MLYWIECTYCCVGIETDKKGTIINAAPIIRWSMGKNIEYILDYLRDKGSLLRHKKITAG